MPTLEYIAVQLIVFDEPLYKFNHVFDLYRTGQVGCYFDSCPLKHGEWILLTHVRWRSLCVTYLPEVAFQYSLTRWWLV